MSEIPPPPPSGATRDVVVVGTSAGGIPALERLAGGLPPGLPAALFVVCHTSPHAPAVLDRILRRAGPLPAAYGRDGEPIERGRIYVAPPDHHLLIEDGRVRVTRGPKENRFRPAIDPLFRSAAVAYGPRVVGVVLSGMLSDGTAGLWTVKDRGGVAVVQDPDEAAFDSMPRSALGEVDVDHCLPVEGIAALLARLAHQPTPAMDPEARPTNHGPATIEVRIALEDNALEAGVMELGEPSPFACPECHGVLLQLKEEGHVRFRCHTGHAYTAEALLSEMGDAIEASVWNTVRALEERVMLLEHLGRHLREAGEGDAAESFEREVADLQRRLEMVRQALLTKREGSPVEGEAALP